MLLFLGNAKHSLRFYILNTFYVPNGAIDMFPIFVVKFSPFIVVIRLFVFIL